MYFFFCPSANLAESKAGNNQNLTGFKTDSLGRMDDSEASNKGFYVHIITHKTVSVLFNFPSKSSLVIIKYGVGSYNYCGSF